MDSKHWTPDQKAEAGRSYANRMAKLRADPTYRARRRRSAVASHLAVLVAHAGTTRSKVAERAGIKPSQLSRQLDGDTNLTLDSIGKICEAVGWDFDIVFRKAGQAPVLQSWEQPVVHRKVLLGVFRNEHALTRTTFAVPVPFEAANGDSTFDCDANEPREQLAA